MQDGDFVHLRVHTAYSLSEGAIRIKDLKAVHRAGDAGSGNHRHQQPVRRNGVLVVDATGRRTADHRMPALDDVNSGDLATRGEGVAPAGRDAVVVLVQNAQGYANLCAVGARLWSGRPIRPTRAARQLVRARRWAHPADRRSGRASAGCCWRAGARPPRGACGAVARGVRRSPLYRTIAHGLENEAATEPALLAIAKTADLPIVATNDAYFTTPDMYEAHDALLCISQGTHLADTNRRRLTPRARVQERREMRALFSDLPDAIANTGLIARRCASPSIGQADVAALRLRGNDRGGGAPRGGSARPRDAAGGARAQEVDARRHQDREYLERLDYELEVICKMGFAGYFLIVAEFIGWAKERGIPVGPGRGSGRDRSPPGCSASPISIRCASGCSSSASSIPSACRCRTSTSTSPGSATRSFATCSRSTA